MALSEAILVAIIGAVVALLTSLIASRVQWTKLQTVEKPRADVDNAAALTDTSMELMNEIRAERNEDKRRFSEEIEKMQKRLELLERENTELRQQVSEFEDVREWAERLVHQLKAHGIEPVKIRARASRQAPGADE